MAARGAVGKDVGNIKMTGKLEISRNPLII